MARATATPFPSRTRRIDFGITDDTDPFWNPNAIELTCAANAVSLMMPFVEPYFARATRTVAPRLDPGMAETIEQFAAEEVAHQVEHRRFNRLVRERVAGIERLERVMKRVYRWLERTRSEEFSLAFTAATETLAYGVARWASDHLPMFLGGAHPISKMYVWHLAEEVEHKSVAFDVYAAVDGSRWRYVRAAFLSAVLHIAFVTVGSLLQLRAKKKLRNPLTWFRLLWWGISVGMEIIPTLVVSCLKGHHPSKLVDPSWYGMWLRDLDAETAGR